MHYPNTRFTRYRMPLVYTVAGLALFALGLMTLFSATAKADEQAVAGGQVVFLYGEPQSQTVVGQPYSFEAQVDGPPTSEYFFGITNKPSWAEFNVNSGALSGTPGAGDVGVTSNIVITVTDGVNDASLPPFDLAVVANEATYDDAPVFEYPQAPPAVNVGELYYWDPGVYDPENEDLTFSALNLPAWLAIDPVTGIISGTPGAGDVGSVTGIVIVATEVDSVNSSSANATFDVVVNSTTQTINVQVNNPNLPFSPSSFTFCAPTGTPFTPQSLTIPKLTIAEDNEIAFSLKSNPAGFFAVEDTVTSGSPTSLTTVIKLQPGKTGSATYSFTLRGQNYSIPVTAQTGDCSTGAVQPAPTAVPGNPVPPTPVGSLQLSRTQLDFAGVVGQPIASQSLAINSSGAPLNWTATGEHGSWLKLSTKSGTTPQTIDLSIDPTGLAAGDQSAKISFRDSNNAGVDLTIVLRLTAAPAQGNPPAGDIELVALEVTQGLQNQMNEMPLVENRATVVLAHLKSRSNKDLTNITGKLTVKRPDGTVLGVVTPENAGGKVDLYVPTAQAPAADRDAAKNYYLEENFFFRLKPEWLNGTIVIEFAGVSHTFACNEVSDSTPDCKVQVNFSLKRPKLPIKILIGTHAGNTTSQAAVDKVIQIFEAYLPFAKVEVTTEPWIVPDAVSSSGAVQAKLSELTARWEADGRPKMHYVAIFDNANAAGLSAWASTTALTYVTPKGDAATLNAHEFIHNYGLGHTYAPADPQYPAYVATNLSEITSGPKAYYGFVVNDLAAAPRGVTTSYSPRIMPNAKAWYGGNATSGGYWIADFVYRMILDKSPVFYGTGAEAASINRPEDTAVTFITGHITESTASTTGVIDSAMVDMVSSAPTANVSGTYSIQLQNSDGGVVATLPFDLPDAEPGTQGNLQSTEEAADRYFTVVAPQVLDENSDVTRLVLMQGNSALYTLAAPEDGAPVIEGFEVGDGETTFTVAASVGNSDPLPYSLEYSRDGGNTWQEVATGLISSASNMIEVSKANLPKGDSSHLRLSVSNGFYTTMSTQDTSDFLTFSNQRPMAEIVQGVDDNQAVGSQNITLRGRGSDPEDGVLGGESLIWYSDRDGKVGTGEELVITADALSEGRHVFSLEAVDSEGLSSFITRTVGSAQTANLAETSSPADSSAFEPVEVLRNRPYAAPSLTTGGIVGIVSQGGSMTTTLYIQTGGDSNVALNWSLKANSLPSWMTLSSSSGQSPATVVVTIDAKSLALGEQIGNLTFESTFGGHTSTVAVPYTISVEEATASQKVYLPTILR